MVTPRILSRVFLFYFEKISGHFSLFWVFREIPAEIQDLAGMKFVLKKNLKKKILKPKQICILYKEKPQKEKKNEKKRNEQSYLYNKL